MVRLDANLPSVDADIDADISEAIADGIQRYEPLTPNDAGWLWSDQLELFLGIQGQQLRWFSAEVQLIPLPEEAERQAKEEAQQRAERLEVLLRSQGINPDAVLSVQESVILPKYFCLNISA